MSRTVRLVVSIILLLVGVVWLLQGIGVMGGSFMTDQPVWAVIGAALVVVGIGLLVRGRAPRA
jgi:hypothetical protein